MDYISAQKNDRNNCTESCSNCYVGWEEEWVCGEKGRREVHYYLKKKDGSADLAVVGKEKSLKHISYHYVVPVSNENNRVFVKLKSRREVSGWLSSISPDILPHQPFRPIIKYGDSKDAQQLELDNLKDVHMNEVVGPNIAKFMWLGSPWTCRKKRSHYQSFQRNGFQIYVQDFVYVLAEQDKRLVAYLEDMYEDSRGNKMVVVRWFHKIDEVGIVLPHTYNKREIFFSLCLQDLSIECIDGLATVLSPLHYEKFQNEASHTQFQPFVCHTQFENDDVKPFDITHVKGYWKQDILRYLSVSFPSEVKQSDDGLNGDKTRDAAGSRQKKRFHRSKEVDESLRPDKTKFSDASFYNCSTNLIGCEVKLENENLKAGCLAAAFSRKDAAMQKYVYYLTIGSEVEVLSQDSGIRGCWYRALIVKKRNDKVKVQYQDIKDAANEAKNLEEWILPSKIAAPDEYGIRIFGRSIVRPIPSCNESRVSSVVNVGSVVDAWWHDGWWEGIVVKNDSEHKLHVYFPGEKKELMFDCYDLRYSHEWLENGWNHLKERPDLVFAFSLHEPKKNAIECTVVKPDQAAICDSKDGLFQENPTGYGSPGPNVENSGMARDLKKDNLLDKLKWNSSKKRRRVRNPLHQVQYGVHMKKNGAVDTRMQTSDRFLVSSPLKVDPDFCKYTSNSPVTFSALSHLTSLVMSR